MILELLMPMIAMSTVKVSGVLVGFYQGLMILQSGGNQYYVRLPPALSCNVDLYSLPNGTRLTVVAERMPSGILVAREIYGDGVKCTTYLGAMGPRSPRGPMRQAIAGTPMRTPIQGVPMRASPRGPMGQANVGVPMQTSQGVPMRTQSGAKAQQIQMPRGPICVVCHNTVPITTSTMSNKIYDVDGYVVDKYPVNFTRLIIVISKEPVNGKYYVYHIVMPPYCNAPGLGQEVKMQVEARREAEAENFHWVWGLALNC